VLRKERRDPVRPVADDEQHGSRSPYQTARQARNVDQVVMRRRLVAVDGVTGPVARRLPDHAP